MAIETKYVCDKCGHEQALPEQMWQVKVVYTSVDKRYYSYGDNWSSFKEVMWCRACMEAAGIMPVHKSSDRAALPPDSKPTIEDLIRELVSDVVQESRG